VIYVNVYVGQTRAAGWIRTMESYGFGEMVCRGELPPRRHPWAFDNGAFKDWTAGKEFDEARYNKDLDYLHLHAKASPDFMVVPDKVAGGLESLKFSLSWVDRLRRFGRPLYLVVQDGMGIADVGPELEPFAGIFVGGTLKWKLQTARDWIRYAHVYRLKCHIGRMGTEKRVRAALRWGADSIDSCLPLWSADNLKRFLKGFEPSRTTEFHLEAP
jgi:hypothetical protein